ncbi:MAG: histidinol-phosphate transaminase [Acidilobaceae archaeon]
MLRTHGGRAPQSIIDFSSPQNPLGPPQIIVEAVWEVVESKAYTRYPDYEYRDLREVLADYYNLDSDLIVPLNGAAEALNLIVIAVKPEKIITFEPTFGDNRLYSIALNTPWVTLPYMIMDQRFNLDPRILCEMPVEYRRRALVILSNPNNPTGYLASRSIVESITECIIEGILVVDEAFADFTLNTESLLWGSYDEIVVLRSLTKILSIPGLRLGFLYTVDRRLAKVIDSLRQPWNINIIASKALTRALRDKEALKSYINECVRIIEDERVYLSWELRKLNIKVYDSKAPFILVEHPAPHPIFNNILAKMGVYVRDASSFQYLTPYNSRVSVRLRGDNIRLVEAFRYAVEAYRGV